MGGAEIRLGFRQVGDSPLGRDFKLEIAMNWLGALQREALLSNDKLTGARSASGEVPC